MEFVAFANSAELIISYFWEDMPLYNLLMISLLVGALCYAVIYVFQAVALYSIAKREGYGRKWMAFVPFFNAYYIGVVSEKNKIFNISPKKFSLALAITDFVLVALYAVFYISGGLIFAGGFYNEVTELVLIGGQQIPVIVGYESAGVPEALAWAGWFFDWVEICFIDWINLIQIVLTVFVVDAFFQTYSGRHHVLFTVFSILFPIKGILFFVVRNNTGKNYRDYLREQQQKQFQMYQQYARQNMNGGTYNYNPYTGQPINHDGDPYQNSGSSNGGSNQDPFDGFGESDNNKSNGGKRSGDPGDPFDDF